MFQRYKSKPSEVSAYQLTPAMVQKGNPLPPGVMRHHSFDNLCFVTTIQGQNVEVRPGEWIAQEGDGVHHYPIADEVFRRKYEPIES